MQHFDAVIVGGGVIGCSVAYYAALEGFRVLVLEKGAIGGGASGVNPGAVTLSSKKPGSALQLAIASRVLYETLEAELDLNIEFLVDGSLTVAENEDQMAFLENLAREQEAAGVPVRMVSAETCRKLNPLLASDLVGGAFCGVDAHINPFLLTLAFARKASALRAELRSHVEVVEISREGGGFAVAAGDDRIACDFLVNAAGLQAPRIGAMLGIAHEVLPRSGHVLALKAPPGMVKIRTASASQLLAKHGPTDVSASMGLSLSFNPKPFSGTLVLGGTNQIGMDSEQVSLEIVSAILANGCRFVPSLAGTSVMRAWAGVRPYAPGGPVLGRCAEPDGYFAAFGHGGDGMALAPVTGRYIAELMKMHPRSLPVAAFLDALSGADRLPELSSAETIVPDTVFESRQGVDNGI